MMVLHTIKFQCSWSNKNAVVSYIFEVYIPVIYIKQISVSNSSFEPQRTTRGKSIYWLAYEKRENEIGDQRKKNVLHNKKTLAKVSNW